MLVTEQEAVRTKRCPMIRFAGTPEGISGCMKWRWETRKPRLTRRIALETLRFGRHAARIAVTNRQLRGVRQVRCRNFDIVLTGGLVAVSSKS